LPPATPAVSHFIALLEYQREREKKEKRGRKGGGARPGSNLPKCATPLHSFSLMGGRRKKRGGGSTTIPTLGTGYSPSQGDKEGRVTWGLSLFSLA